MVLDLSNMHNTLFGPFCYILSDKMATKMGAQKCSSIKEAI